jgi:hypothetical protein
MLKRLGGRSAEDVRLRNSASSRAIVIVQSSFGNTFYPPIAVAVRQRRYWYWT